MKIISSAILLAITMMISPSVLMAQEIYVPQIETSEIQTFSDYDSAKLDSWRLYNQRKMEAWREYNSSKMDAWREYSKFELASLLQLRNENFDDYLKWIDADKIGNHILVSELETSVFEIQTHITRTRKQYGVYEALEEAALVNYQALKDNAFAVYTAEKDMAYEAYRSHQN